MVETKPFLSLQTYQLLSEVITEQILGSEMNQHSSVVITESICIGGINQYSAIVIHVTGIKQNCCMVIAATLYGTGIIQCVSVQLS